MATVKLTLKQGQRADQVVASAGTPIAGSDAIELNIDTTDLSKSDVRNMLQVLEAYIHKNKWLPS